MARRIELLGLVPLLAFLYMFIAPLLSPAADKLVALFTGQSALGLHLWTVTQSRFTTSGFWVDWPLGSLTVAETATSLLTSSPSYFR